MWQAAGQIPPRLKRAVSSYPSWSSRPSPVDERRPPNEQPAAVMLIPAAANADLVPYLGHVRFNARKRPSIGHRGIPQRFHKRIFDHVDAIASRRGATIAPIL